MARPRSIPDSDVFLAILRMIAAEGEKAVAFSSVGRATGLAGASLVQRYGALPALMEAAFAWGWEALDRLAAEVEAEILSTGKGAPAVLKALGERGAHLPMAALLAGSLRHATLRDRASAWRGRVEAMLAPHLHDPQEAAMLFALWQGQVLWEGAGGRDFRLKDALKRLG